eukprot:PhM_4_TR5320/c0_g1_i7/m.21821
MKFAQELSSKPQYLRDAHEHAIRTLEVMAKAPPRHRGRRARRSNPRQGQDSQGATPQTEEESQAPMPPASRTTNEEAMTQRQTVITTPQQHRADSTPTGAAPRSGRTGSSTHPQNTGELLLVEQDYSYSFKTWVLSIREGYGQPGAGEISTTQTHETGATTTLLPEAGAIITPQPHEAGAKIPGATDTPQPHGAGAISTTQTPETGETTTPPTAGSTKSMQPLGATTTQPFGATTTQPHIAGATKTTPQPLGATTMQPQIAGATK